MSTCTTIISISAPVCVWGYLKVVILDVGIPKTDVLKSKKSVPTPLPNPEINGIGHVIQFWKAENSMSLKNKLCPISILITRR